MKAKPSNLLQLALLKSGGNWNFGIPIHLEWYMKVEMFGFNEIEREWYLRFKLFFRETKLLNQG